jgi:methanogenic corrinoid protein MtbC1
LTQLVDRFERALLTVDRLEAIKIFNKLIKPVTGTPFQYLEKLIIPVLERIGEGWKHGRVALSQVYMSGRICEELVDTILPPGSLARRNKQNIAITVLEDYHLLGKRIIYSALRASGFDIRDYGRMEVDELCRRVKDDRIRVLLISTLMLSSALRVKELRVRLKELAPETGDHVKIIVGGAPFRFDDQLWREVGADVVGSNTFDAVNIISRLTGGTT